MIIVIQILFMFFYLSDCSLVYICGKNDYGQLGTGNKKESNSIIINELLSSYELVQISSGSTFTLALLSNETILSFGSNNDGELGLGDHDERVYPTLIKDLNNVTAISTGNSYSIALLKDGTVWSWGLNQNGQLGIGNRISQDLPVQIPNFQNITSVYLGYSHSFIIDHSFTVYSFGLNDNRQLCINNFSNLNSPTQIPNLFGVMEISAGAFHSILLLENGTLLGCGSNNYGQLGLGSANSSFNILVPIPNIFNVKAVSVGESFSYILLLNGSVLSFGRNNHGQLGQGDIVNRYVPILNPTLHSIVAISSGYSRIFAFESSGTVQAVGWNYFGQLCLGDQTSRSSFTKIPNFSFNNTWDKKMNFLTSDSSFFLQNGTYMKSSRDYLYVIIGSITGGTLLIVLLIVLLTQYLKYKKRKGYIPIASTQFQELKDVAVGRILGRGGHGEVYLGKWNGAKVALKSLKVKEAFSNMDNEIKIFRILNHPNILKMYGSYSDPKTDTQYIVMEYMEWSLDRYLPSYKSNIEISDLVDYALQVVSGMVYLSSQNIVHGDLSCRNLLLKEGKDSDIIKISDFGLSKIIAQCDIGRISSEENLEFPVRHSAPEVLNKSTITSSQSDVWSFGVVCYELFSYGGFPYKEISSNKDVLTQVLSGRLKLEPPELCPEFIASLMQMCFEMNPKNRPTFRNIIDIFARNKFKQSVGIDQEIITRRHSIQTNEYMTN